MRSFLTLIAFLLFLGTQAQQKAIRAGKLIDVVTGKVFSDQLIIVDSTTIIIVAKFVNWPVAAERIDLSDYTVLPGLIDCHTHLTFQAGDDYYDDMFRKTPIDFAVRAHVYAKRTLQAGFTMVRDLGSEHLIDISLRNAINDGFIEGPRMLVATFPIGATGGHIDDLTGFSPNLEWRRNPDFTGVADGVDEIRKRVRSNVKFGADWIKVAATAGVLSEEASVGNAQYSLEELKAVVEEAHRWGREVAAHAHGADGIKLAVKAGVKTIEHGSLIDDEGIRLMKANGCWLVSDIYDDDYILSEYAAKNYPEKILEKERSIGKLQRENFEKAVKAGVKVAYGTDAGVYPHGWNAKQFFYMVKYGLSPMEAIQSATINAAELLGWKSKTGSVSKDKLADIIAVKGDPLKDVTLLEKISFVMKEGKIYKNETVASSLRGSQ